MLVDTYTLLIFQFSHCLSCWPPFALRPLFSVSAAGTSPPATTTRPPPHPSRTLDSELESSHLAPTGCRAEMNGLAGWFPRSPDHRSVREVPSSPPAASPRLRRRPSPWPPHRWN